MCSQVWTGSGGDVGGRQGLTKNPSELCTGGGGGVLKMARRGETDETWGRSRGDALTARCRIISTQRRTRLRRRTPLASRDQYLHSEMEVPSVPTTRSDVLGEYCCFYNSVPYSALLSYFLYSTSPVEATDTCMYSLRGSRAVEQMDSYRVMTTSMGLRAISRTSMLVVYHTPPRIQTILRRMSSCVL